MKRSPVKSCVLRSDSPLLSAVPMLALLVALLMPSCKSVPFFGGGFKVEIAPMGGQSSQLQGLYVIVSPEREVADPLRSGELSELLEENKIDNQYTSFRQYRPTANDSWELEFKASDSGLVTYEVKESVLTVEISKDIGGSQGIQYSVVVLGFFGSAGFKQVTINQTMLDAGEDQRIEVGAAMLSVTGA